MKKHAVITTDHETIELVHKKRNKRIDVAIIVAVILLIGAAWWFGNHRKHEVKTDVPQYSAQQLVQEVNKKYGANDYGGAIKLIQGQKTIKETSTQLLLAAAFSNSGDHKKSLEIYEMLDKQGKLNETDTATAAGVAEQAKEYQKAIDLYKKAKERLKGSSTNSLDQAAVYDYKIAQIEKKL